MKRICCLFLLLKSVPVFASNSHLNSSWSEVLGLGSGIVHYKSKSVIGFPFVVGVQWNQMRQYSFTIQTGYAPVLLAKKDFQAVAMWQGVLAETHYWVSDLRFGAGVHALFRPMSMFPTIDIGWKFLSLKGGIQSNRKWYTFLQVIWAWSTEPSPISI